MPKALRLGIRAYRCVGTAGSVASVVDDESAAEVDGTAA
jgi:hypothetical protein